MQQTETRVEPACVVGVVCAECDAEREADRVPDACFACGVIDPPWLVLVMHTDDASVGVHVELAGSWSPEDRAEAERELAHLRPRRGKR